MNPIKRLEYRIFRQTIEIKVKQTLGEFNSKREALCLKAFKKRLNESDALSYIILNS